MTASDLLAVLSQHDQGPLVDALVQAVDSYGPDLEVRVEDGPEGKVRFPAPPLANFTIYVQR